MYQSISICDSKNEDKFEFKDTSCDIIGSKTEEAVLEWLRGENTWIPKTLDHLFERVFLQWILPSADTLLSVRLLEQADIYNHMDYFTNRPSAANREIVRKFCEYNLNTLQNWDSDVSEQHLQSFNILKWLAKEKLEIVRLESQTYPYATNQLIGYHIMFLMQMGGLTITGIDHVMCYISKLKHCSTKFQLYEDEMRNERDRGRVLPKICLEKCIKTLQGLCFMLKSEDNFLIKTPVGKYKAATGKDLPEEYRTMVINQVTNSVIPAFSSLIRVVTEMLESADDRAGIWKFPNGDAIYKQILKMSTTTSLTPEEVHQIGLREVATVKEKVQKVIKKLNENGDMLLDAKLSVSENLLTFSLSDKFHYENTEEGKAACLAEYKALLAEVSVLCKPWFTVVPSQVCDLKPMLGAAASGGSPGYYMNPSMDLSRPGCFFANISNMNNVNKAEMRTLIAHESVPGHHYQISTQIESTSLPHFRRTTVDTWNWTNPFSEGWGLYAEKLAHELGFYDKDLYDLLGYYSAELWRSARCVVDTGLHYYKWSREQAIEYMVQNTPKTRKSCEDEVDRYCVLPGQACSYKIGQLKLLELRRKCKEVEGEGFDLKRWHDKIFAIGAVPLELLEEIFFSF